MSDSFTLKMFSADAPQRVGPLLRLPGLLREFGVRIEAALEGTGIEPAAFADPDNFISYRSGSRLLDRCARMTGCPHFGLLLGARCDCRDLGLPGQLMMHSASLEDALLSFVTMQRMNSRGASVYLHRARQHWVWGAGIYEPDAVAREQIYGMTVAIFCKSVQLLTAGAVKPVECVFPYRQPDEVTPYGALLGATVRFDQREAGIVLPRSALNAPVAGADRSRLERLHQRIAGRFPPSDKEWTERVNHAIRPLILRGQPTTSGMADLLGVNVRTLTRRLDGEGTTFQALLDTVRYGMARELLFITNMSIGDVADALAYAHQSSFTEAFVRWSGMSPSNWRRSTHEIGTDGSPI